MFEKSAREMQIGLSSRGVLLGHRFNGNNYKQHSNVKNIAKSKKSYLFSIEITF